MPIMTEVALVAVPMAVYLYALGGWHGGPHPRVITGGADLAWLMFGLSGLIAFGPLGRTVVSAIFGPDPSPWAWLVWSVGLLGIAGVVARLGRDRVVVYHAEGEQVRSATAEALADSFGSFAATLIGFEDPSRRTSVTVQPSPRSRTVVVEAQGDEARSVMAALRLGLRARMLVVDRPASALATAFFIASGLVMLARVVGFITFDPQGRRAARTVGRWLGWA